MPAKEEGRQARRQSQPRQGLSQLKFVIPTLFLACPALGGPLIQNPTIDSVIFHLIVVLAYIGGSA